MYVRTYLLILYSLFQPVLPAACHVLQLLPLVLELVQTVADGLAGQLTVGSQLLAR